MRIGFHISISGGFKNVVERAKQRGCKTIQVFSRNPRGWKYGPLDSKDIEVFRRELYQSDIWPVFVHMPYLPNLATPKKELFKLSVSSLVEDLKRCEMLGARFLVMHVGSAPDESQGIQQMITGINQALDRVDNNVTLLLENTAGSGNELGYTFEQLARIIAGVRMKRRIGVVFDTAHAFEAGYDLRTQEKVRETFKSFNSIIGLERLKLVHFNDSKTKFASRSDRHWHIGKGEIGKGMAYIIQHPALKKLPFIMETPRTGLKEDLMNMRTVRRLLKK